MEVANARQLKAMAVPSMGGTPFPVKLYEMLETADESIVSWQPKGRCFMIRDEARFVEEVLPM